MTYSDGMDEHDQLRELVIENERFRNYLLGIEQALIDGDVDRALENTRKALDGSQLGRSAEES